VAGSSESSKYEFLEKKGLTKAEIDEAFRRARQIPSSQPAAAPAPPPTLAPSPPEGGRVPPQKPWEAQPGGAPLAPPPKPGLRLSQAVLLLGAAGGAAYCFRSYLGPLADAVKLALGTAPDEVPGSLASREGNAESVSLEGGSREGSTGVEDSTPAASTKQPVEQAEWEGAEEMRASLADVKAMVSDLAAKSPGPAQLENEIASLREDVQAIVAALKNPADFTPPPGSPGSRAAAGGVSAGAFSAGEDGSLRSLMTKTRESLGGGEALTPATLYSPAKPRVLSPSPLPSPVVGGSAGVPMSSPSRASATGSDTFVDGSGAGGGGGGLQTPGEPPRPHSYMEVLEMLEQGKTPPGIRTDINDKPPNPSLEASSSELSPRAKPWERAAGPGGSPAEPDLRGNGDSPEQGSPAGGGSFSWKPPPPPKSRLGST